MLQRTGSTPTGGRSGPSRAATSKAARWASTRAWRWACRVTEPCVERGNRESVFEVRRSNCWLRPLRALTVSHTFSRAAAWSGLSCMDLRTVLKKETREEERGERERASNEKRGGGRGNGAVRPSLYPLNARVKGVKAVCHVFVHLWVEEERERERERERESEARAREGGAARRKLHARPPRRERLARSARPSEEEDASSADDSMATTPSPSLPPEGEKRSEA